MTNANYYRIFDLPPTLLRRTDLQALEQLVRTGLQPGTFSSYEVSAQDKDRSLTAATVDELLALNLPEITDKFSMRAQGGDESISHSIDLTLYHNYVSCHVRANEEVWFLGKIDQIRTFFDQHRPWYWQLRKGAPLISGILIPLAIFSAVGIAALAINTNLWYLSLLLVPALLLLTSVLVMSERYLPYVRVEFVTKGGWLSYQAAFLAVSVLSLLATVGGVVVAIIAILSTD
jgi:hypothetical protein